MDLGRVSVSLAVSNGGVSREFYENLGFKVIDGQFNYEDEIDLEPGQNWVILEHGSAKTGLFQGMLRITS